MPSLFAQKEISSDSESGDEVEAPASSSGDKKMGEDENPF